MTLCLLNACETAHKYSEETQGYWEAKALIKDKKKNKNFIVKIESYLKYKDKMRIEVSSPFGDLVGVIVLNNKILEVALPQQKTYYKGKSRASALKPLLSISLDPQVFYAIYFDRPIENKNWSCTNDESGFIKECLNMKSKLKITWSARLGKKKTVFIKHRKIKVQLNIRDFSPILENEEKLFKLRVPKGYKKISI